MEEKEKLIRQMLLSYLVTYTIYAVLSLVPVWLGWYDYEEAFRVFLTLAVVDVVVTRFGKKFNKKK